MTYYKNLLFYIFLFFFVLTGIYFSINVGITHDETHDYYVWISNKNLVLNFFFKENLDTNYLSEGGKFYGIGFHYISSIIEFFSVNLPQLVEYEYKTRIILSKHITVFLLFVTSGLIFKKIIYIILNNDYYANLSTVFYLLYPYLLGHSFFNVKDIPFLTFWLVCTYFIIKITKNYLYKETILKRHIIFLSFFTSYLLSIRISGILIFIQYLIFISVICNVKNISLISILKKYYKELIFSVLSIFIFYFILQPSFWANPILIFDAIKYMSQHIQTVCTITLGECMKAQNLPASYLPIWFFFKLPIIILLGLLFFFVVDKKIEKNSLRFAILASLSFSVLAIICLLILFNVNLYNEIRQVMFLVPLIFIISLSFIYFFSKNFFNISIFFFIIFFIFQNISIYPYNYIWINNFSHIIKVNNVFELDYWGASTRKLADVIIDNNLIDEACLISNRNDAFDLLINQKKCLISFKNLYKKNKRPFYVALLEKGVNKGTPNNCNLIFKEETKINFSNEKLVLAKLYRCD